MPLPSWFHCPPNYLYCRDTKATIPLHIKHDAGFVHSFWNRIKVKFYTNFFPRRCFQLSRDTLIPQTVVQQLFLLLLTALRRRTVLTLVFHVSYSLSVQQSTWTVRLCMKQLPPFLLHKFMEFPWQSEKLLELGMLTFSLWRNYEYFCAFFVPLNYSCMFFMQHYSHSS